MTQQIQSIPMNNLQHFINSTPSALRQAAIQKILTASRPSQIPQTSKGSDHISSCVRVIPSALSGLYCNCRKQLPSCPAVPYAGRQDQPPHHAACKKSFSPAGCSGKDPVELMWAPQLRHKDIGADSSFRAPS